MDEAHLESGLQHVGRGLTRLGFWIFLGLVILGISVGFGLVVLGVSQPS